MLFRVGIDIVRVVRIQRWIRYSDVRLSKIFSPEELVYVREGGARGAERLAVRFCVREAITKALSAFGFEPPISFFLVCKAVVIRRGAHGLVAEVSWDRVVPCQLAVCEWTLQVSCAHENEYAVGVALVGVTHASSCAYAP